MNLQKQRLEKTGEDKRNLIKAHLKLHLAQNYAAKRITCTYGDIVEYLKTNFNIEIEPISVSLATLLGDISSDEHKDGCPLLSIVVTNKDTMRPGEGFYKIAKDLGVYKSSLNNKDEKLIFFTYELKRAFDFWEKEFDPQYIEYKRLENIYK